VARASGRLIGSLTGVSRAQKSTDNKLSPEKRTGNGALYAALADVEQLGGVACGHSTGPPIGGPEITSIFHIRQLRRHHSSLTFIEIAAA
jgi:hypothetical protein